MEVGSREFGRNQIAATLQRVRYAIEALQAFGEVPAAQAGRVWFEQQWARLDRDYPLPLDTIPFESMGVKIGVVSRLMRASDIAYLSPEMRWRSADDPVVIPAVLPYIMDGDGDGFMGWLDPASIELVELPDAENRAFCVESGWSSVAVAAALDITIDVPYIERYSALPSTA